MVRPKRESPKFFDRFPISRGTGNYDCKWQAGHHYHSTTPARSQLHERHVLIISALSNSYTSLGMLTTWNKFCFTTGYIEVSVSLPGRVEAPGLWPGVWTLGNLVCHFGATPLYLISS